MKRFTSLLLILAMILTAAYASAEGDYISIDAQIRTGDQEVQANLNIYPEEDRFYFTSSLIPDICIQLAGISPKPGPVPFPETHLTTHPRCSTLPSPAAT